VHEIVDRAVPLSDLWGEPGDRLARELADLGSDPILVLKTIEAALGAHLSAQTSRELSRSDLVHGATKGLSISANQQPEGVRAIARRLSISERHLRNLFTGAVGVSPKRFARIDRVRTVLARAHHEHWAQLATEAGYYDQSHMSAEFREIMGVRPSAFIAGRVPAAVPC
jgi:methylphosphotriester-DNA--protein-cysteine methyltransferase